MKSNVNRLLFGFVATFFAICVGLLAYDALCIWPIKDCEERGNWWDEGDHVCAVPVQVSAITGRKLGLPSARAGAAKPATSPAKATIQSPTKR